MTTTSFPPEPNAKSNPHDGTVGANPAKKKEPAKKSAAKQQAGKPRAATSDEEAFGSAANRSGAGPTHIEVRGAREHNLANVDVDIPRDKLVVICGVSGSGKSTLAFDTVYAEGQRRYVESLSAYARQFLGQLRKPNVDSIDGLSPAVAIDQKTTSSNPRSTVGTVTEIHDHLRLLFARAGVAHCPTDGTALGASGVKQMVDRLLGNDGAKVLITASVAQAKKGTMKPEIDTLIRKGFTRARVDGRMIELAGFSDTLDKNLRHDVDVVVDRVVAKASARRRITESLETALREGDGQAQFEILGEDGKVTERQLCSLSGACSSCGTSWPVLEPRTFSFNSPFGACAACDGLGALYQGDEALVVNDTTKTLAGGAISPWTGLNMSYQRWALSAVCAAKNIPMDRPWAKLTDSQKRILLDGVSGKMIARHRGADYEVRYEGIRPWLTRRFADADTDRKRDLAGQYMREVACGTCRGQRLNPYALAVTVGGTSIAAIEAMTVTDATSWFETLHLDERQAVIAERVVREIKARLGFLESVGLGYLTLDRSAKTLSGGEAQRIRLASQVGAGLAGVLYVLDEPSIGLHPRDNQRLLATLFNLRDLGNTVLVVEHDEETIRNADWVIDVGPKAGVHGGRIVAEGVASVIQAAPESLTGKYLRGELVIDTPAERRSGRGELVLKGVTENNLRGIDAAFPLGCLVSVCGVSGSGKSSLISDVLHPALARHLHRAKTVPGAHRSIEGLDAIDKCISIDQSPIGRTPRSNPATYTGVFDKIRALFGELPEARARGWKQGRFSFNVTARSGGGRCEACEGDGTLRIEMSFLPDVFVPCERCDGRRYTAETLEVTYKGHSIADVLDATVEEARELFSAHPSIKRVFDVLFDVGLGYVKLGQPATQLSGGEAQRVKLASELCKRPTGKTVYLLDEPTTGLHFDDVAKLVSVLQRLVDTGNTVIVVEHNVDVIRCSDWVLELGPDGGAGGGMLVAQGTPEQVAATGTATAPFLAASLSAHPAR